MAARWSGWLSVRLRQRPNPCLERGLLVFGYGPYAVACNLGPAQTVELAGWRGAGLHLATSGAVSWDAATDRLELSQRDGAVLER